MATTTVTRSSLDCANAGPVVIASEARAAINKKLPTQKLGLFASSEYLAGRNPAMLDRASERLLVYDDSYGRLPELDWLSFFDLNRAVIARTRSTRGLLNAAIAGAGVVMLPTLFARHAGLIEVASPAPLKSRTPWLVAHRDVRKLPEVAAVHAWVISAFRHVAERGRN